MTAEENRTNVSPNFRPAQASVYLGISKSKLAKLRMTQFRHLGPRFVKVAGCIVYRKQDLDHWLAENLSKAEEANS